MKIEMVKTDMATATSKPFYCFLCRKNCNIFAFGTSERSVLALPCGVGGTQRRVIIYCWSSVSCHFSKKKAGSVKVIMRASRRSCSGVRVFCRPAAFTRQFQRVTSAPWRRSTLTHSLLGTSATAGEKPLPCEELSALLQANRCREQQGRKGARRPDSDTATAAPSPPLWAHFPQYQLLHLTATGGGGAERGAVREALAKEKALQRVMEEMAFPPTTSSSPVDDLSAVPQPHHHVVIVGCQSASYLTRVLDSHPESVFTVLHHSLETVYELSRRFASQPRIRWVHCSEAMFFFSTLLPQSSVDVCVVPLPVPFGSAKGSYRRVVHHDFCCAVHRTLKTRDGPADPRGLVVFTDSEASAAFMVEELEASKLMVPWARKRAQEVYGSWLPSSTQSAAEFPGWHARHTASSNSPTSPPPLFSLAASKGGPTPPAALEWIHKLEFKRRYHRSLYE